MGKNNLQKKQKSKKYPRATFQNLLDPYKKTKIQKGAIRVI